MPKLCQSYSNILSGLFYFWNKSATWLSVFVVFGEYCCISINFPRNRFNNLEFLVPIILTLCAKLTSRQDSRIQRKTCNSNGIERFKMKHIFRNTTILPFMKGILCTPRLIPHLMTFCQMIKGKSVRKSPCSRCIRCSFKGFNRYKIIHT